MSCIIPKHKYLVSIPRSGQHMTERSLKMYHELMGLEFKYCDFYSGCRTRPCTCRGPDAFQKDHDFSLLSPINENDKYLFLYRSNISRQVEADYRLYLSNNIDEFTHVPSIQKSILKCKEVPLPGKIPEDFKIDYKDKNVQEEFREFLIKEQVPRGGTADNYYNGMHKKWRNTSRDNILAIDYCHYTSNFVETFTQILSFFYIPII